MTRWTPDDLAAFEKMGGKWPERGLKLPVAAPDRARIVSTGVGEVPVPPKSAKAPKYGNRRTGGYASAKEAKRAAELKLLEAAGKIRNLREQVVFELIPAQAGERACTYKADFVYLENRFNWHQVVEDVKSAGTRTQQYIIRRKLMLWVHGIKIREI